MKRVLVTGAGGFVGAPLCQALAGAGYAIVGMVRSRSEPVPGVNYLQADLLADDVFTEGFPEVDCIIHLAGRAHVLSDRAQDPLVAFRNVNRDATLKLAARAMEVGVKRFIFISSIGVNGNQTFDSAFDEQSVPQPHADYARSKLEAEEGLQSLVADSGMELVIIRPPLIYGVNAPGNFARLLRLVASGLPLPLGGIRNLRSLVSLENMVSFILHCIEHRDAVGQIFLLADGQDVSTTQMIESISAGMGKRTVLFPVPGPLLKASLTLLGKGALHSQLCGSLQIDSSKARQLLGWMPTSDTLAALEQVGRSYAAQRKG